MHFQKGNCDFADLRFEILPHTLRVHQPSVCHDLPNIDFSWGFPNPWILTHTDVIVPSLHRHEGRQFDGEIVMSHVYSTDMVGKRVRARQIIFCAPWS